jgi:hypothetical protein
MRKIPLLVLTFSISTLLFGQRYAADVIIKKADSLLISAVGKDIFKEHFRLDSSSYFETQTIFHESKTKYLTRTRRTNGKIRLISVRYAFFFKLFNPYITTSIYFDQYLHLQRPIELSFIPLFVRDTTKPGFLTETDAMRIAKTKFVKKGIKTWDAALRYDPFRKLYLWTVTNTTAEYKGGYNEETYKEMELLEIDGLTGKILNYYPGALEGPLH